MNCPMFYKVLRALRGEPTERQVLTGALRAALQAHVRAGETLARVSDERDCLQQRLDDLRDEVDVIHCAAVRMIDRLNTSEIEEGPDEKIDDGDRSLRRDIVNALGECTGCLPAGETWAATDCGVVQYVRDIVAFVQASQPIEIPKADDPPEN